MSKCSICLSQKPGLVFPFLGKGTCYPNHLICSECMNKAKTSVCPVCRSDKVDVIPQLGRHRIEAANPVGTDNEIIFDKWYHMLQNPKILTSFVRIYIVGYIISVITIGMYWSLTNIIENPTMFRGFWGFLVGIVVGCCFSLAWPILVISLSLYMSYHAFCVLVPNFIYKIVK